MRGTGRREKGKGGVRRGWRTGGREKKKGGEQEGRVTKSEE